MKKDAGTLIWFLIGAVALIASIAVVLSIVFGGSYGNSRMYGPYWMMGGFGIWLMPIFAAVALIVVVIFIYFLISLIPRNVKQEPADTSESPVDIARGRYARGELSEEEYKKIIDNLNKR